MIRIGSLTLRRNLVLAPMTGITNYPFRQIMREHGCPLTFTEMISAEGLLKKRVSLLRIYRGESPIFVQLFGGDPYTLAEASSLAESFGAHGIDLNMGCPADQVVRIGAGVALMRNTQKVKTILLKVRKAVRVPLTIKIRSGWDEENQNAIEIAKIGEECGVDGIFIHPRTGAQRFRGKADWNLVRRIKESVYIPVIGNGDVTDLPSAKRRLEETGCDGIMIGRGAIGNPWIFSHPPLWPSLLDRLKVIHHTWVILKEYYNKEKAIKEIRRQMAWYTKGLPFSASFRFQLFRIDSEGPLFEALQAYFKKIEGSYGSHLF